MKYDYEVYYKYGQYTLVCTTTSQDGHSYRYALSYFLTLQEALQAAEFEQSRNVEYVNSFGIKIT